MRRLEKTQENLQKISERLPEGVALAAVSKFHPIEALRACYDIGQRIFAESRVQELEEKHQQMPSDVEWHFIGHLQRNKVKYIVPYVALIHSVDSIRLLKEIEKCAEREGRIIDCLLQLHLADEETKYGLTYSSACELLKSESYQKMSHVRIVGIMTMATNTECEEQIEEEFEHANKIFNILKEEFFADEPSFYWKSWGMSGDYLLALRHGANIVRVGSAIFGPRVY